MSIAKEVRRENYERLDQGTVEQKVLWVLALRGPQCGEDIMRVMGTSNPNNVRPRLSTMAKAGKVREVEKRKNADGRSETVYEITQLGHAALREYWNQIKKAAPGVATSKSGERKET